MVRFAIIEVEDGFAVTVVQPDQTPEEAAVREHGTLVDPGPYTTYEEAADALSELESDAEEREEQG